MATRRIGSTTWARKAVAGILTVLVLATSAGLSAGAAAAAPPGGGGGNGGGGGGGGSGVATPKLIAVVSLSNHRLLATYDRNVVATALAVSSYDIRSTEAVNLPVTGVTQATVNQVYLLTGPQEPVTYTMRRPKTPQPVTFTGSSITEPTLVSATPVSSTQIVLLFSERMGASAADPTKYTITASGTGQSLPVLSATLSGNRVVLTTAPQGAVPYVLRIGDIQSELGIYIDPTVATTSFVGSTVPAGPMLLSAAPQGENGLLLTFDTPLAASAAEPARYTITPTIAVSGATLQAGGTKVLLETGTLYVGTYNIRADVFGADGSAINPNFSSIAFEGTIERPAPPEPDTIKPKVVSAGSANNTTVLVQFSEAMSDSVLDTSHYAIVQTNTNPEVGALPVVAAEFVDDDRMSVRLTTRSQNEVTYQVTAHNVTDVAGNPLADKVIVNGVLVDPTSFVFAGTPPTGAELVNADCNSVPTLTGVIRHPDGGLLLTFDRPLDASADEVGRYDVVEPAGTPLVSVTGASLALGGTQVLLATSALAPTGTYSVVADVVSYCDTLHDHEEYLGWPVTIELTSGETIVRQVTSNPDVVDSDGDGLTDDVEKSLSLNPRDVDTDDDLISDWSEFNEYFSDPTVQDTDGDSLYDGLETTFFLTSPIFADTDGDQLRDDAEINVNRNPKVADLPAPVLQIGEASMKLDVRFTESDGETTRELDAFTAESTLVQSESQEFSRSEESTHEVSSKLAEAFGVSVTAGCSGFLCTQFNFESTFDYERSTEQTDTTSWTSSFSETSTQATEQAYTDSLTTEAEVSTDSTVTRTVDGAEMSVAVVLESAGDVAFTARNLQVTALIADPVDPTRLTPVATLVPDPDPEIAFNLGPLVPAKGPIIFKNTDIFPQVVEALMRDPKGLVFRFSNYDITDEAGRNFAFTSQEVNDRTARVAIDYGGFDPDGDGKGTSSEILRVATGVIGRRIADTNGDGAVDGNDRSLVFDSSGNQTGLSLRDALRAAGLTEYDEAITPSSSLSVAARQNSYSVLRSPDGENERLFRVRGRQIQPGSPKSWEILTATGIDRSVDLDEQILLPGQSVTLSFLEDLDQDEMPAVLEAMHNCIDTAFDTDNDGLDDRFEVMVGWRVAVPGRGVRDVHSSCSSGDTDGDALGDFQEAPGDLTFTDGGLVLFDRGVAPWVAENAPRRDESAPPDPFLGWELTDPITDPTRVDTDADGLGDGFELTPYQNELRPPNPEGSLTPLQATSAERGDSDGDGVSDGLERSLGGNPRVADLANLTDTDRDGLVDGLEATPYPVSYRTSTPRSSPDPLFVCEVVCPTQGTFDYGAGCCTSNPGLADSDGDGLGDAEERDLGTSANHQDTDFDGMTDFEEVRGIELRDLGVITTNPRNADTDNDKRTDGEEAGRGFGGRWVVTVWVPDTAPYEAFSHPLRSDTDLDGLLDGDEQAYKSDPTKFNTDGDTRRDVTEVFQETRIDVPDLNVTVSFGSISIAKSGDEPDDDAEDFSFELSPESTLTLDNGFSFIVTGSGVAKAGRVITMTPTDAGVGSVSTSEAVWEEVLLDGFIRETDGGSFVDCNIDLAAIALPDGDAPARIAGRDLVAGIRSWNLHRVISCNSGNTFEVTLNLAIRAA